MMISLQQYPIILLMLWSLARSRSPFVNKVCWLCMRNYIYIRSFEKVCTINGHRHRYVYICVPTIMNWYLQAVLRNLSYAFTNSSYMQHVTRKVGGDWNWFFWNIMQQGKSEEFESCDWPIVRKRPIWVKIGDVLYHVTLKFDGWPWKTIGHLSFAVSSFVQHFIAIGEFKLELQSGNAQLSQIWHFLEPCDLEIWQMTLKNNRALPLCSFKLYASFRSHRWIQAGGTVRKRPIWVKKNRRFLERCDLAIWPMTLKNNRAPLLCYFKLCASFRSHRWFQTWVIVRKRPIWVKFDDF